LIYIYKKGSANKCLGFQTISKHHRSIFFIDHVNFLLCLNFLTVYPTEATTNVCWKDPRTQNYVFDPPKHNNTTKFLIGTSSCFSKWGIPQNHGFQSYSLVQVWMIWVSSVGAMCDVWDDLAGLPCGGINPKHRMVFAMVRRLGMEVPYLWKSGCFFLVQICLKLSTFFLSSWTWGVSKVYCALVAHVFKLFVFFFCKSWNIHNQHQIPNFHVIGNYRTYQTQKLVIKKRYGWFHQ
jgi:hypothetical protein